MLAQPLAALKDQLDALIAEDGMLDAETVHMFDNNYTPDIGTIVGDLMEATFPGYATSTAVEWGAVYNIEGGKAVQGDRKQFTASGAVDPQQTVYGYYLMSGDVSPKYLGAERFDTPVALALAGDAVGVVPSFSVVNQP